MKMDAGMDTGDSIDQLAFKIPFHRTVAEFIKALEQKGPKFLNTTLRNFWKKIITAEKQREENATYCQKIEKIDGEVDSFNDPLEDIYPKYRAYFLRPKIWFELNGKTIIVEKLVLDEQLRDINKEQPLVVWKKLNSCVQEVLFKPEGKKAMDRNSFSNGYLK